MAATYAVYLIFTVSRCRIRIKSQRKAYDKVC